MLVVAARAPIESSGLFIGTSVTIAIAIAIAMQMFGKESASSTVTQRYLLSTLLSSL